MTRKKPRNHRGKEPVLTGDGELQGNHRTCMVTRRSADPALLLRFVADPTGMLTEDLSGRLPGRGVHVMPEPQTVKQLLKRRGALGKLAKVTIQSPDAEMLVARIGRGLERRLCDALGLGLRAGGLILGLRELEESVARGERPLILMAADTAANSREKVLRLAQRPAREGGKALTCWEVMDRDRIGLACGKGPVAVAGVLGSGVRKRVAQDAWRWLAWAGHIPQMEEQTDELE
ncbi:DUF448 domain-containing protein [Magnetococcus sp. PR-3]|uniref:DUF448 domain-containing protein n=1 Tax=Magnetococcus sp. PR-3 TaxID=3120355 RepID=UPI002FCE1976